MKRTEKERDTKKGKRSVHKQKKGGKKTQGARCLFPRGGAVSRMNGSGGGGLTHDPNSGVRGGTYPSSTTRVEGYDLWDI